VTGSVYVAQAGLQLLDSSDPLASASQVGGTKGVCHNQFRNLIFFGGIGV
jgi:hypothetical protein